MDAGFSFTHIIPFFEGQPLLGGVKRINIGGKALSNHLKELVSYRCAISLTKKLACDCDVCVNVCSV